ncbi:MAG TPA: type II toxin-antitoxin system prevent-host-death family antitoxin [Solirubrobacteraceae bacterium]|jgi:prevent-host-death family protein
MSDTDSIVIGLRELSRETASVFERLQREQRPLLVSRQGQPVAALVPLDEARLEQFLRQTTPGVADAVAEAHDAVVEGRTRSLAEIEADTPRDVGREPTRESATFGLLTYENMRDVFPGSGIAAFGAGRTGGSAVQSIVAHAVAAAMREWAAAMEARAAMLEQSIARDASHAKLAALEDSSLAEELRQWLGVASPRAKLHDTD